MVVAGIAVAAALGALARFGFERALPGAPDGTHYLGTLAVNLSGALALGVAMGALGPRFVEQPSLRYLISVGFLSSYTTFSAVAYQTVHLLERGAYGQAAAYGIGTLVGGTALAFAGLLLGRLAA